MVILTFNYDCNQGGRGVISWANLQGKGKGLARETTMLLAANKRLMVAERLVGILILIFTVPAPGRS